MGNLIIPSHGSFLLILLTFFYFRMTSLLHLKSISIWKKSHRFQILQTDHDYDTILQGTHNMFVRDIIFM